MRLLRSGACFLTTILICGAAVAQPQAAARNERADELHAKLQRRLNELAQGLDGVMGLAAKDLASGETFTVNPDMVFPQASSIKIPVLLELFRQAQAGALKLDERVEVKRALMAGGSGVLLRFSDGGSALSLRDLAVLMIVLSDNTATNILIDRVGMNNVNELLSRHGLKQTRLQRRMIDTESQRAGRENLSTPAEMIWLLGLLHQGKLLDGTHTAAAMEILKYPKNTSLRRGLPANVELAGKPGGLAGVACESGIVLLAGRPYAISVMTTYNKDTDAANEAIAEVSRRVFDHFERLARSNPLGVRLP
jgi:beta-lactamase class A